MSVMPDGRSAITFASSWGRDVISAAIGFKVVDVDAPDLVESVAVPGVVGFAVDGVAWPGAVGGAPCGPAPRVCACAGVTTTHANATKL